MSQNSNSYDPIESIATVAITTVGGFLLGWLVSSIRGDDEEKTMQTVLRSTVGGATSGVAKAVFDAVVAEEVQDHRKSSIT